jgi:hypothetical protein
MHSWHCHVGWIQSGLCCAYSRLLSQELDVYPNFLFWGTTLIHSKALDSDGVSTSCYLWWKASKPHHLVWVTKMYGICFFHVAHISIATLLETHFLEAKVSGDSHTQDTIRTDTTFHQLWLFNTCLFMLTHWHITWCRGSTTLSNPQNVTSSLRTCGTIWIHDVSLYMSTYSSAVCLANRSWITVRNHSFVHICGTAAILEFVLFMHTCCYTCTNYLWHIVTAHMIYIVFVIFL